MDDILPGKTRWETEQYRKDCGKHATQAQAFVRLGLLMEYDEDFPAPMGMTLRIIDSKSYDVLWGAAALPSAGDEAGQAAVDRFAAKHHIAADWEDGHYRAIIHLGGSYLYEARYLPERSLRPVPVELAATA